MAIEYIMRAFKTTVPTGHVYWSSIGSPDLTGIQSGYNPADLTSITTDYTTETPVNGNPITPVGLAGGDLSNSYPNPIVVGIQGNSITATPPLDGQVLTWVGADGYWEPVNASGGGSQIFMAVLSYDLTTLNALGGVGFSKIIPPFDNAGHIPNARMLGLEVESTPFAAPGLTAADGQVVAAFPSTMGLTGDIDLTTADGYTAPFPQTMRFSIGTPEIPQLQMNLTGASFSDLTSGSITVRLLYTIIAG